MPWLTCTVELPSRHTPTPVTGDFEGRSVYECAWLALCDWCQQWHFDRDALVTVRHGNRVWRIRQERLREWRPLWNAGAARRMLWEARQRDPEGTELPLRT